VNILDIRNVDPARFDGLNRELPITFKEPWRADVISPREQLVPLLLPVGILAPSCRKVGLNCRKKGLVCRCS
jgi:hypothetical protein